MDHPPYTLCLCPDSYLLRLRVESLLSTHAPSGGGAWQRFVFWGDEPLPQAFWEHLTLQGLFATAKALIIKNAQNIPAEGLRTLSAALLRSPSATVWPLVCFEVSFDHGKPKLAPHIQKLPLFRHAEKNNLLDITQGLTQANFTAFISKEAARLGINLTPVQAGQLATLLPMNAQEAGNELAKLALCTTEGGRLPPNPGDIVGHTPELGIFELLRALQQKSSAPAVWRRILEDQLGGDNMVFAFNSLVLREARTLWQILAGEPVYLPPQAAAAKKTLARSLGFSGIARLWELALQADKGIKTGERTPDQAFEALAAELFLFFHAPR